MQVVLSERERKKLISDQRCRSNCGPDAALPMFCHPLQTRCNKTPVQLRKQPNVRQIKGFTEPDVSGVNDLAP